MSSSIDPIEESQMAIPNLSGCHQDHPTSLDWRVVVGFVLVGIAFYFAR
ncbi:MAG: hypothetical protein AB8B50_01065 [Pirellulaceae bacterium]